MIDKVRVFDILDELDYWEYKFKHACFMLPISYKYSSLVRIYSEHEYKLAMSYFSNFWQVVLSNAKLKEFEYDLSEFSDPEEIVGPRSCYEVIIGSIFEIHRSLIGKTCTPYEALEEIFNTVIYELNLELNEAIDDIKFAEYIVDCVKSDDMDLRKIYEYAEMQRVGVDNIISVMLRE